MFYSFKTVFKAHFVKTFQFDEGRNPTGRTPFLIIKLIHEHTHTRSAHTYTHLYRLSGLFSGLTLGLMGLDMTGLEIVMGGSDPKAAKNAKKIRPVSNKLLLQSKHYTLQTTI